ncbi:MAG: aspartate aminotransferase family protein, partial [Planctomycetaceae bacterium]
SKAYHGDTVGTVSLGGIDLFHATYGRLLFNKLAVPSPVAYRVPDGYTASTWVEHCFNEVERTLSENQDQIAAFVIEPLVQGAGGILVHPEGYLRHVRDLTAKYGIPLIADEVAVGFGRTGTLFACEQEQVSPDIICLAKGITGGYLPLAATITTDELFSAFLGEPDEGKTFFHGHTYTGNPLAAAAAIASLKLFKSNRVMENVSQNVDIIRNSLKSIADHPHVGEIRQKGIMVGIELVADRETKTPFSSTLRMGHRVTLAGRKRGIVIRPLSDVVVLMPAPGMPGDLVEQLCEATIESINEAISTAL